jgi:hypothetical protein
MLAAPIGIEGAVEADIGGFVPGDGAAGGIDGDGGPERRQILILALRPGPAVILPRAVARFIASRPVGDRTAALAREIG